MSMDADWGMALVLFTLLAICVGLLISLNIVLWWYDDEV